MTGCTYTKRAGVPPHIGSPALSPHPAETGEHLMSERKPHLTLHTRTDPPRELGDLAADIDELVELGLIRPYADGCGETRYELTGAGEAAARRADLADMHRLADAAAADLAVFAESFPAMTGLCGCAYGGRACWKAADANGLCHECLSGRHEHAELDSDHDLDIESE